MSSGRCPLCGAFLQEDGKCPDGHEAEDYEATVEATRDYLRRERSRPDEPSPRSADTAEGWSDPDREREFRALLHKWKQRGGAR